MSTVRQLEANRQNAEKSTGPRSEEGKGQSRRNALRHGLAGGGVVLPDPEAEAVRERLDDWRSSFQPATADEEWVYEQMVINSVRVERCQREEQVLRAYQAGRAGLTWDEDHDLEIEELATSLAKRPPLIARRLTRTSHGCDWLISRWRSLGEALENGGAWTPERESLARDLQGVPLEFRDRPPTGNPAGLIAEEIGLLERLQAVALDDLDDREQTTAARGLPVEPCRAIARLRRYEAACLRLVHWARARLNERPPADGAAAPEIPERTPETLFLPLPVVTLEPEPPAPAPTPVREPGPAPRAGCDLFGRNTSDDLIAAQPALPRGVVTARTAPAPEGNRQARRAAIKLAGRR